MAAYLLLALCAVSLVPQVALGAEWSMRDYPNPMTNWGKCNREEKSYLCDPDGILDKLNADQLEKELEVLFNQTQCKCSQNVQCGGDRRGFRLGVALMKKIKMRKPAKINENDPQEEKQYKVLKHAINEAQLFAYNLLTQWNLGRCGDDMILIYSQDDNVLFTFTGELTQSYLPPSTLAEITMKEKNKVRPRGDILAGLRNIIRNYKNAINGSYKRSTSGYQSPQAQAYRERKSGEKDGSTEVKAAMIVTSLASLVASLALHW